VSAYLTGAIVVDTSTQVVSLWTGSDDAIRVWLDERLLVPRPVLRGAAPDQEKSVVDLSPGRHVLLVEVSNHLAGFGFYLRSADEHGKPMRLTDDGHLVPFH